MSQNDRIEEIKSTSSEFDFNEARYKYMEIIRKYRKAHGISIIGHQIINFALMVSTGGYVKRLFVAGSHCSPNYCTGT